MNAKKRRAWGLVAGASTIDHWHVAPAVVESLRQPKRVTHTLVGPSKPTQTAVPVDSTSSGAGTPTASPNNSSDDPDSARLLSPIRFRRGGCVRFMVTPVSEPGGFAGPPDARRETSRLCHFFSNLLPCCLSICRATNGDHAAIWARFNYDASAAISH
jgi:hypothetical protein